VPDCLFVLLENIPEDTMICTSGRIAIVFFGNMFDDSNFNGKYDILSVLCNVRLRTKKIRRGAENILSIYYIIVSFD